MPGKPEQPATAVSRHPVFLPVDDAQDQAVAELLPDATLAWNPEPNQLWPVLLPDLGSTSLLLRLLGQRSQHLVICGDDGLARGPAVELDAVCGEAVTVVLPHGCDEHGAQIAAPHRGPRSPIELLVAGRPDERTLRAAGARVRERRSS